jgi:chromosome segregation ATPase
MLVADDGHTVRRFTALSSPPDRRGILRAAYSVPAATVTPDTVFSLELEDGGVIALPTPTPADARVAVAPTQPAPEPGAAPEAKQPRTDGGGRHPRLGQNPSDGAAAPTESQQPDRRDQPAGAEAGSQSPSGREHVLALQEQVSALQAEVDQARSELATHTVGGERLLHEIETLTAARKQDRRALEQAQDALRTMTMERDELSRQAAAFDAVAIKARGRAAQAEALSADSTSTLAELETWREELERRLAATTTELDVVTKVRSEAESEQRRLRGELAEAEATLELEQARTAVLEQELETLRNEYRDAEARHDAETERITAELEQVRAERDGATQAADAAADIRIRAADAERNAIAEHARRLESERDDIARRAERLAALLASADQLGEIAGAVSQARTQAESLHAQAAVPPQRVSGAGQVDPVTSSLQAADETAGLAVHPYAGPGEDGENGEAARAARELEQLSREAEAEAREQVERELLEAVSRARNSGI